MYIKFQCLGLRALNLRFEMCQEGIFCHDRSYLRHKHKLLILSYLSYFMTCSDLIILSRLSDFVTCSERFNIQSDWSISQL